MVGILICPSLCHCVLPPFSSPSFLRLTPRFEAFELDGRFFVNPGSATGAFSGQNGESTPSFALLDVQGPVIVTYVYQLVDGEVKVDKVEYRKPDQPREQAEGSPHAAW